MIGFPFDSHVTFESDGTPVYVRTTQKTDSQIINGWHFTKPIYQSAGRSR